jgi:predicted MFS family arabinose efflux permease
VNLQVLEVASSFGTVQGSIDDLDVLRAGGMPMLFDRAACSVPRPHARRPTAVLLLVLAAVALAAYPYFSAQQGRLIAYQPAGSGSLIAWNNSAMYAGILIGSAVGG